MKLVNLTPHAINLMPDGKDGQIVTIPPSGTVARCTTRRIPVDTIEVDGISVPINHTEFGEVTGLPEPQEDVYYIVSSIVAQAVRWERDDVLIVDDTVRDDEGRIIGARALAEI